MKKSLLILILVYLFFLSNYAQTNIVKDINTGVNSNSGIEAKDLVNFNNKIYFTANDDIYNYELWSSDGTATGTHIEVDLILGTQGSWPKNTTSFDTILIFSAIHPSKGRELYISDGTQSGTYLVKDINPGYASSNPRKFVYHNGLIYFVANTSTHGIELWKTDGTSSGTVRVTNFSQSKEIFELTSCGSYLYFNTAHNYLYRTDGTTSGTILLKGQSGWMNLNISLCSYNNTLYFIGSTDKKIWKSNGTVSGTVQVLGSPSVCWFLSNDVLKKSFAIYDSLIYFVGSANNYSTYNLYSYNGTILTIVKSNVARAELPIFSTNDYLYYLAYGSANNYLVRSDGTSSGTVSLINMDDVLSHDTIGDYLYLNYRATYSSPSGIYRYNENTLSGNTISMPTNGLMNGSMGVLNGSLYFSINSSGMFCKANHSSNIATRVLPNYNNTGDAIQYNIAGNKLVERGNQVFFAADDGVHGKEPWVSDGTELGTVLLKDIKLYSSSSNPSNFINIGGSVYFFAYESSYLKLFRSDGTSASTVSITSEIINYTPKFIVEFNGNLLYGIQDGLYLKLGLYNTTTGALQTTVISGAYTNFSNDYFLIDGNKFYLSTLSGVYVCNGSLSNIVHLPSFELSKLIKVGNYVVFRGANASNGVLNIFKTTGTVASTSIIYQDTYNTQDQDIIAIGNDIYFIGHSSSSGFELWKANVNSTGASIVKDINPGYGNSSKGSKLVKFKNKVYFFAYSNSNNLGLYCSDGTSSGTVLYKNFNITGLYLNESSYMEVLDDELIFSSPDGIMFKTKGTPASVEQLGDDNMQFKYRALKNNKLFFFGERGFYSYGSAQDSIRKIAGNVGFSPGAVMWMYYPTIFEDKILFEAETNKYGFELYRATVNNRVLINIIDSLVCDTLEISISSFALNQPGLYHLQASTDSLFSTVISLGSFQLSTGEDTIKIATAGLQTSVPYYLKVVFNQDDYIAPSRFIVKPTYPSMSFVLPNNQICDNDSSIILTGGLPVGGEYSGVGISNNILDLSQISQYGDYVISYNYQDSSYCTYMLYDTLTISEIPYIDLGVDTVLCQDEYILLSVYGNFSPLWSTGSTAWYIMVDTTGNGLGSTTYYCTATTLNNCSFTDTIVVTFANCLGIEEVEEPQIKVFPNPTAQYFDIQSNFHEDEILLELYNELGKVVFKEKIKLNPQSSIRIDISSLNKGSYILKLFTKDKQFIQNIIKM